MSWLIVFWPGVMSVDSLKVWRAARLPDVFLNDHPLLNVILYKYLLHLWDNIAIVPLFHILLLSTLLSSIFFSLYRQKVTLIFLVPCYLCLVFSIPVGLYNIVLWKDIPFGILVIFWAFTLSDLYRKKIDGCFSISYEKMIVFFLLYLALGFIRHNGMLYLIVIPFYIRSFQVG